jgi:hypothetical protein
MAKRKILVRELYIGGLTRRNAFQLILNKAYQVADLRGGSGPNDKTVSRIDKSIFLSRAVKSFQDLVKGPARKVMG